MATFRGKFSALKNLGMSCRYLVTSVTRDSLNKEKLTPVGVCRFSTLKIAKKGSLEPCERVMLDAPTGALAFRWLVLSRQ